MITVNVVKSVQDSIVRNTEVKKIVSFVCEWEHVNEAELSFVIVHDRLIRKMNKKFLGHDYVTDVITFPLEPKGVNAEIYINTVQLRRQAREYGVTFRNELIRLIVHGTLHAIGYDDTTVRKKKKMDSIQERYVSALNENE